MTRSHRRRARCWRRRLHRQDRASRRRRLGGAPSVRPFRLPGGRATLRRRAARPESQPAGWLARAGSPAASSRSSVSSQKATQLTAGPHALGHGADGEVPPLEHLSKARGRQPHRSKPVGAGEWPARRRAEPRLRQPPTVRYQRRLLVTTRRVRARARRGQWNPSEVRQDEPPLTLPVGTWPRPSGRGQVHGRGRYNA